MINFLLIEFFVCLFGFMLFLLAEICFYYLCIINSLIKRSMFFLDKIHSVHKVYEF